VTLSGTEEACLVKKHDTARDLLARNMKRLREALGLSQIALVERAVSKFEVQERLEQGVLAAIQEALDEKGSYPRG